MNSLPERIMEYAEARPEATPIQAEDLQHLGDRAAVARALSRLVRSDRLLRICRGVYMRPIQTRFRLRAPSLEQAITALASLWGETIVSNGGDAASWLGLTTQNAVRTVYLTSGPDRLPCISGHTRSNCSMLRVGNWRPHMEPPAPSSGRFHGSVPARPRGVWMPCCRSSRSARVRNSTPDQSDAFSRRQ